MTIQRRSLLLGLATLALAACASKPDLSHIQDPNADFRAYRTFAFFVNPGDRHLSLLERRLIAAARTQLESRGYVYNEFTPDLLVNIAAVMEARQGARAMPGAFPGNETAETDDYRLGRLGIDVIDVRRQDMVWQGTAEGRVTKEMLRDAGSAAEKAVAAVFQDFPVKVSAPVAATLAPTAR